MWAWRGAQDCPSLGALARRGGIGVIRLRGGGGGLMGAGLREEGGKQTRQGKGKRKLETSPRGKTRETPSLRHLETPGVEGGGNSCKGALLALLALLRHAARIG